MGTESKTKLREARKLAAITMVAAGYAGDMPDDLCYDLLDDIDFHFNKVKCRKIEQTLPQLNKMVEDEMKEITLSLFNKSYNCRFSAF